MSKLKKAIERVGKRESGPIGFGQFTKPKRRAMLLAVAATDESGVTAAAKAGADVILLEGADASGTAKAVKAAGDLPLGVIVDKLDSGTAAKLADAKADVIASPFGATAATAVDTSRNGHVISLDGDHADATLRALGPLGLDALLVDRGPDSLTLEQQAKFVRVAQLTSTPLLFRVKADVEADELRVLRDSGGAAIVLPSGSSASEIEAAGKRLEEVPEPKRGEGGSSDFAMVPSLLSGGGGHEHEEEEDDPGEE